jgi:divinyl chlorophyllide a 8-vinyl-reductase
MRETLDRLGVNQWTGFGEIRTPREQGEHLFALLGRPARFTHVPVGLLSAIARLLGWLAKVVPPLAAKAEYARIGHYYATESMLVLNTATSKYDADATPATGTVTLLDYYQQRIRARAKADASG